MLRRTRFSLLIAIFLLLAPLASAAIVGDTSTHFSTSNPQPGLYNLSNDGQFASYFFSPFAVGDLAWDSGSLLVGHSSSGTIARTDTRGGLINLIHTPVVSIDGLAVSSAGNIFAAERNTNRLFKLTSTGQLLGISFLPQAITALGITANDDLIFARRNGTSSSSLFDIVFWDFDLGEISSVGTNIRNVRGISAQGEDILLVGSQSTSFSSPTTINRFSAQGTFIETLNGPQNLQSITAHAPEPGTALLMGLGLAGLNRMGRRRLAEESA